MPLVLLIVTYDRSMSIMEYLKSLSTTNNFLNIYLAVILLQNCILILKYSKEYEASFIYDVLPISKKKNMHFINKKKKKRDVYEKKIEV